MTARLVLWRPRPPFRKVVQVRRVTVGGFIAVVARIYQRAAEATLANDSKAIDPERIAFIFRAQDYLDLADQLCVGQDVGFFGRWLGRYERINRRNMSALLAASRAAEGEGMWTEMLNVIRAPVGTPGAAPQPDVERGDLMDDINQLCTIMPGLDPVRVLDEWTMQRFLLVCARIRKRGSRRAQAAPKDPPAKAAPPRSEFAGFTTGRFVG